jgi:hypothetical protein
MVKKNKCRGVWKNGKRCTYNALENGYCRQHQHQARTGNAGIDPVPKIKTQEPKEPKVREEKSKQKCKLCGSTFIVLMHIYENEKQGLYRCDECDHRWRE